MTTQIVKNYVEWVYVYNYYSDIVLTSTKENPSWYIVD